MDAAQMLITGQSAREREHRGAVGPDTCDDEPSGNTCFAEHAGEPAAGARELTDREQQVLAFERQWWQRVGAKERAVRELFALSPARYYQLLNALVDEPAALREDPTLIKRLRRVRASRQRVRDAHQPGIEWH